MTGGRGLPCKPVMVIGTPCTCTPAAPSPAMFTVCTPVPEGSWVALSVMGDPPSVSGAICVNVPPLELDAMGCERQLLGHAGILHLHRLPADLTRRGERGCPDQNLRGVLEGLQLEVLLHRLQSLYGALDYLLLGRLDLDLLENRMPYDWNCWIWPGCSDADWRPLDWARFWASASPA